MSRPLKSRAGRRAPSFRARRKTTSSRNTCRAALTFSAPAQSRLTQDLILFTTKECPRFNPINVCSYHLQEAGATPSRSSPMRSRPPSPFSTM
ncbi:MAG: methylmalonyl-CoA mutase family protein [Methylocystis sp.]